MKRLFLIRHGLTDGNIQKLWLSWDSMHQLNEIGKQQMTKAAQTLKQKDPKLSAIHSSPAPRALESAQIIAKFLNVSVIKEKDINEFNFGLLKDQTVEYAQTNFPNEYNTWSTDFLNFVAPNGESTQNLRTRILTTINKIVQQAQNKDIICVTHEGPCRIFLADVQKVKQENRGYYDVPIPSVSPGAILSFTWNDNKYKFEELIAPAV